MSVHFVCVCACVRAFARARARVCVCVCVYLSGRDYVMEFSNLAKYGHGPPEDGFKGDRNM